MTGNGRLGRDQEQIEEIEINEEKNTKNKKGKKREGKIPGSMGPPRVRPSSLSLEQSSAKQQAAPPLRPLA